MEYTGKKQKEAGHGPKFGMNEILRALHERKSVRLYEDRPVPDSVKAAVLEAAVQAPTAGNQQLYTILDITDPQLKHALSITCDNQPFIAQAPMVLVFLAALLRPRLPEGCELLCAGTNALATSAMLKAGAARGATGEHAIVYNAQRAHLILGPMGILLANGSPRLAYHRPARKSE